MLPLEDFPIDRSRKNGRHGFCKPCVRRRKAEWQKKVYRQEEGVQSLDEFRAAHRAYTKKRVDRMTPEQRMWNLARHRSMQSGLQFTITIDDIQIPPRCPILGIELDPQSFGLWHKEKKKADNLPSIDRIDSSLGYTKENIQVISWRANNLKGNATLQELELLGKYAEQELKRSSTDRPS